MKHTKGPWKIDATQSHIHIGTENSSIAWMHAPQHHGIDTKANAYLIAAAPELLEALETFSQIALLVPENVWAQASDEYNAKLGNKLDTYKFSFDLARNAIAKARGES